MNKIVGVLRMNKFVYSLIIGMLLFLSYKCTDEIVVPELEEKVSFVSGYVSNGMDLDAVVYLIDSTIIDSIEITNNEGFYEFENVKYGVYKIKVLSRNSLKKNVSTIYVNTTSETVSTMYLSELPYDIDDVFPRLRDTIKNNNTYIKDSIFQIDIVIQYGREIEMDSIEKKILIDSGMTFSLSSNLYGSYDTLKIQIPADQVFNKDSFSIYFDSTINTTYGDIEHEFYLKYYVDDSIDTLDTTSSDTAINDNDVIYQTSPADTSVTFNFYSSEFKIYFNSIVNKSEIEDALNISPIIPFSTSWSTSYNDQSQIVSVLYIEADQQVMSNTVYTITIDSGTVIDSTKTLQKDLSLLLKTPPLKATVNYPLYGQIGIPRDTSLYVSFSQSVLESSLDSNITISPAVEGLKPTLYYSSYNKYRIDFDTLFLPKTTYTLTIKSGVSDIFGKQMPDSSVVVFTTGE